MAALSPQQDPYGLPPPEYHGAPNQAYRPQAGHMTFNQPAPRQRTAIACRYCRRRKIRCSGFESSADGRCTNCQRFNQECIFTPVSSQAQAFVPAHTAYPHLRNAALSGRGGGGAAAGGGGRPGYGQNAPVIYGAHGQPLNALAPQTPYAPDGGYGPPDISPTDAMSDHSGRRRGPDEPRTPTLPALVPGAGRLYRRDSSTDGAYADASVHRAPGSPASSTASYHAPYPHAPGAGPGSTSSSSYYPEQGRTPPQSYAFERNSSSPRESSSSSAAAAAAPYAFPGVHPPLSLPPRGAAEQTPPPAHHSSSSRHRPPAAAAATDERRPGMSIQNMLDQGPGQGQGGRSATDHEMLDALMPRRGI
ncbi:MAG: hypothetical protein M1815_003314 [Lichina confinis]|nr:MAG: hypothetical protein M1815_003314 [Lichina confinis]